MKRVFIYGDSNVWGDKFTEPRIPYHLRWVNRLKRSLRGDYEIIADGVCGRVAGNYRKDKPDQNGQSFFCKAYEKAGRINTLIIALGTNDLQERFGRSANDILTDLTWYESAADGADIIYILPPNFSNSEESGPEFTSNSQQIRKQIIENKEKLGNCIVVNDIELSDGVHFSVQGHKHMADIVGEILKARG